MDTIELERLEKEYQELLDELEDLNEQATELEAKIIAEMARVEGAKAEVN
jgi:predicted  nucleic acid-binding Zn-ribbon protein